MNDQQQQQQANLEGENMDNTADSTNVDTNSVANPAAEDQPQVNQDASTASLEAQLAQANAELAKHKEAAAKWVEYEESQKTEAQKQAEKIAALEAELAAAKAAELQARIVAKYGIKPEDLELLGSGDEKTLEARAKRIQKLYGGESVPSDKPVQKGAPGSGVSQKKPDNSFPLHMLPPDVRAEYLKKQAS